MDIIKCPTCGTEIPLGETICPVDGTDVTNLVNAAAATMPSPATAPVQAPTSAGVKVTLTVNQIGSTILTAPDALFPPLPFTVELVEGGEAYIGRWDPRPSDQNDPVKGGYGPTPPAVDLNCLSWFSADVARKQAILTRTSDGFALKSLTDQVKDKAHGLTMIDHSTSAAWDGRDPDDLGAGMSALIFDGDTIVLGNVYLQFAVVP